MKKKKKGLILLEVLIKIDYNKNGRASPEEIIVCNNSQRSKGWRQTSKIKVFQKKKKKNLLNK